MFQEHLKNAKAVGLDVGVYFFSQAITEEEAAEEANFVLEHLNRTELECPIFFDLEEILDDEARTDGVSGEQFTKNSIVFCDLVEAAGYDAMVYSNMLWESFKFDMKQIESYGIWYADYEALPH